MKEPMFWHQLKYLVCRALDRLKNCDRHGIWCEQFVPEHYEFESTPGRITGHVWIGVGPREHEKWKFVVMLKQSVLDKESIDWSHLLPPDRSSSWIAVDSIGRHLALDPGAAVPE